MTRLILLFAKLGVRISNLALRTNLRWVVFSYRVRRITRLTLNKLDRTQRNVRFFFWNLSWSAKGWFYKEVRDVRIGTWQMRLAEWGLKKANQLYITGHERFVGYPRRYQDLEERVIYAEELAEDINWEQSYLRDKLNTVLADLDAIKTRLPELDEMKTALTSLTEIQTAINADSVTDPNYINYDLTAADDELVLD